MSTRRVYLRLDDDALTALRGGSDVPAGTPAFAVTAVVRAAFPDDEEEDLEYAALWVAAGDDVHRRRVVAAVDLPARNVVEGDGADRDGNDGSDEHGGEADIAYRVHLPAGAPRSGVVSVHVGEAGSDPDDELDWYDVTELDDLGARGSA